MNKYKIPTRKRRNDKLIQNRFIGIITREDTKWKWQYNNTTGKIDLPINTPPEELEKIVFEKAYNTTMKEIPAQWLIILKEADLDKIKR